MYSVYAWQYLILVYTKQQTKSNESSSNVQRRNKFGKTNETIKTIGNTNLDLKMNRES